MTTWSSPTGWYGVTSAIFLRFSTSAARRQASAQYWSDLVKAIKAGDAARAEHVARSLQEASRDHMIAAMAAHRALPVAAD